MISKYNVKRISIVLAVLSFLTNTIAVAEDFEAVLSWSKRAELSTPVNGLVQQVFAQPGNIVAKGEVLVQLDPRLFKADLKYAKARFKNTEAQSQEAKRELERQTDMYDRTMLSEHELQVAKNNFTSALSQFQQAKAALTKAKLNLEYSAIRAPFNAVVIRASAVKGQVVASEITPPVLVVVAEAKRMLARFYVAADKVNNFVLNQGAKVNVAGQVFQGKISNIALEPDTAKTGGYAVDVLFDSQEKLLRAGQKGTVDL